MDVDSAQRVAEAAGGGIVAGGPLLWLAKKMVERLVAQLDAVATKVGVVSETVAGHTERLRAIEDRVSTLAESRERDAERLEAVRARTEGLSSDYGPRIRALEEVRRG